MFSIFFVSVLEQCSPAAKTSSQTKTNTCCVLPELQSVTDRHPAKTLWPMQSWEVQGLGIWKSLYTVSGRVHLGQLQWHSDNRSKKGMISLQLIFFSYVKQLETAI